MFILIFLLVFLICIGQYFFVLGMFSLPFLELGNAVFALGAQISGYLF